MKKKGKQSSQVPEKIRFKQEDLRDLRGDKFARVVAKILRREYLLIK